MKDDVRDDCPPNELCCCPPVARVWPERRTDALYVENAIDMKRRLMVRADANASLRPPSGPDTNADGRGGSQIDEGTFKPQGKVYRTDHYTVHWRAEGAGPLQVGLTLAGDVTYDADWLPSSGDVTLSASDLLEPPDYGTSLSGTVKARLIVRDCNGQCVSHQHALSRPPEPARQEP